MPNPLIPQGTLNRVRCSVVVPAHTGLNVTSAYMSQAFASIAFEGSFSGLIGTATGAVPSPEPYVFGTITASLLKTQALAGQWMAQAQSDPQLGAVTVYPDSSATPAFTLNDAIIQSIDPAAFDGKDPAVRVTIRGIFYASNDLWSMP